MTKKRPAKSGKKKKMEPVPFDKYDYYRRSVQSPETDVAFLRDTYKEIKGARPTSMREDFCGTFSLCCEWVKLHKDFQSIGVDLDPVPLAYGKDYYLPQLKKDQQKRIQVVNGNVLDKGLPTADIIAAMNFSYFTFKERKTLLKYFRNGLEGLNDGGLFLVDCFGGSQCYEVNEEETEHDGFSYFWDQDFYDPINNHGIFYIHFKVKGRPKQKKCFTYDWRMWSIPELREAMLEAGFKDVHVYWEGTTDDGDGDGEFKRVKVGEDCESWVAYVVGEK